MTIILHCGAKSVTLGDLRAADEIIPAPTDTYHPIPHVRVVELAERTLRAMNYEVRDRTLGLSSDGFKMFGLFDLQTPIAEGVNLSVGVRNSHDKTLAGGLVAGERVLVCDNLAFSGEIKVSRRHTKKIEDELGWLFYLAVGQLKAHVERASERVKALRRLAVSDREMNDLLVRAAKERAIVWTEIPKVLRCWEEPPYDDFAPRTGWSALNAFTDCYRSRFEENPELATQRTIAMNGLFQRLIESN